MVCILEKYHPYKKHIVKFQKTFRGHISRLKQLPLIMYKIKKYIKEQSLKLYTSNEDGRINSCFDEDIVIKLLIAKFGTNIQKPEKRHWYDILVYDYIYGWIPVNIKSTTTLTSDNTGNFAMCVYAYTDEKLNTDPDITYQNGKMSEIIIDKLTNKKYNRNYKKDYYFIVLNKTNKQDVIVNSVKGLSILTPNINNLPFQVCWDKNRVFTYKDIIKNVNMFVDCLKKPKPCWKETFMTNVRTLEL